MNQSRTVPAMTPNAAHTLREPTQCDKDIPPVHIPAPPYTQHARQSCSAPVSSALQTRPITSLLLPNPKRPFRQWSEAPLCSFQTLLYEPNIQRGGRTACTMQHPCSSPWAGHLQRVHTVLPGTPSCWEWRRVWYGVFVPGVSSCGALEL